MKKSLLFLVSFVCFSVQMSVASTGLSTDGDGLKASASKGDPHAAAKETWEFYSASQTPTAEELQSADNHKLGKEVAYLYALFMDMYVVKEEVVPGDPSRRTVIRKPGIYNAVRSIEKQLNKEVKNSSLTKEEAATDFVTVLKIALAAIDSESQTFEEALQSNKKDTSLLLAIFDNVNLKSLY